MTPAPDAEDGAAGGARVRTWARVWARVEVPAAEGAEPDYRFTLANERTFLARIRTALALLAGGVAIRELGPGSAGARSVIAVAAVVLSIALSLDSYLWWVQVQRAMRRGAALPVSRAAPLLAIGGTVIAVAALVVVVS